MQLLFVPIVLFPDVSRYLLYDVKYGEGFNLQKEIFVRAVTAVDLLNEGRVGLDSVCGPNIHCFGQDE